MCFLTECIHEQKPGRERGHGAAAAEARKSVEREWRRHLAVHSSNVRAVEKGEDAGSTGEGGESVTSALH